MQRSGDRRTMAGAKPGTNFTNSKCRNKGLMGSGVQWESGRSNVLFLLLLKLLVVLLIPFLYLNEGSWTPLIWLQVSKFQNAYYLNLTFRTFISTKIRKSKTRGDFVFLVSKRQLTIWIHNAIAIPCIYLFLSTKG